VRAELPPAAPFIVLGECSSGPIAIAIAAAPPSNLRAYVAVLRIRAGAAPGRC
jgi:hypothetical protein